MEGAEKMIEFRNLSFSYGDKDVLKNLSLKINDGDRVCFFGESGIGKTTILRIIMGLEKVDGEQFVSTSKKISSVFQENRLLPFKTIEDNIKMFSKGDKLDYILNHLGISETKNMYPSELSGGMARRVAIARALSVDADLYIFDEPFTGLDRENIEKAVTLINEITAGKTFISVVHEREYADLLKCKIIELKQ
jgi:NitT/TauT family transport system ATP-binding protein